MKNLLKKYQSFPVQVKASFWFLLTSIFQKGISVFTTPIFTRLLTPEEFGQFNVFLSWQSVLTVVVILYLPWGVYEQGVIKFEDSKDEFTSSLLGLDTTLVLTWTLIYLSFNGFFNKILTLNTYQGLAMLVMMWTSSGFSFWAIQERSSYHYKKLVIVTFFTSLFKPILGIYLVTNFADKVTARIIGLAAVEVIMYSGLIFSEFSKGKVFFKKDVWKYAILFNITLIPHYLSQTVLNSADRIMIQKLVGYREAGIYSLAYSLSQLMLIFNTAVLQTMNPWIYRQIKSKNISDISRRTYPILMFIMFINLLLVVFAPEIVQVFAPAKYYEAIWIIPPVAMSVAFIFMYSMFATFEFYFEKTRWISVATLIGAVLNIFLNFIFINLFGFIAAGYTTLVCYLIYAISHFYFMNRVVREYTSSQKVYEFKKISLLSIAFMSFGLLIMLTYTLPVLRYTILGAILTLSIIFRNRILEFLKDLVQLRQSSSGD